jgi:cytochrome oxidase assembly protein ShyY1
VLTVLFTRRWLRALLAATAFAVAAYYLGQWQWGRYEEKSARADRIASHYAAPAVPVTDVVGSGPLPLSAEWTHVEATGSYAGDDQLFVRNRPHDGTYGYEVVAPFRTGDGTILVDRGWVANSARSAAVLPDVPPPPNGTVTVTGWLRQSEPDLGRDLPARQLASVNIDQASSELGTPLLGGYLQLQSEQLPDGSAPPRPEPFDPPDRSLGPHQAYAFQWWGAMSVGFILIWFGVRRELSESSEEGVEAPARPKKVRVWDEEDA